MENDMKVAAMFLNTLRKSTPMWVIEDRIPESEHAAIDAVMGKYMEPTREGGGWNYWIVSPFGATGEYIVGRVTWDQGFFMGPLADIDAKLHAYHTRWDDVPNPAQLSN